MVGKRAAPSRYYWVAGSIPGWQRFKAADDWIAQHASRDLSTRDLFERFLVANNIREVDSPEKRAAFFRQFMEWQRSQRPSR